MKSSRHHYPLLFVMLILLNTQLAGAETLLGQTYPIIEDDFLVFIQTRLQQLHASGALNRLQQHQQVNAQQHVDRPQPVLNVSRTLKPKTWLFDPSVRTPRDIFTPEGYLIAGKGTLANPLTQIGLSKTLLFYDAADKDQMMWARQAQKKLMGKTKLILVNGSIVQEAKYFSIPVFFDQEGRLCLRFGITHTPAIIVQEGLSLRVSEVLP